MMTGEKRDAIRDKLKELELVNGGRLTPAHVLAEAKNKASVLHDQFEWDDKKAAHQHRLDQARTLITSVTVTIHTERTIVRGVAYVRDPSASGNEQGYRSVQSLRSEPDVAREALMNEARSVKYAMHRLKQLSAAFEMSAEVEAMIAGMLEFERKIVELA